jgi:hypothetical protein
MDSMLKRGEQLDELVSKSEHLSSSVCLPMCLLVLVSLRMMMLCFHAVENVLHPGQEGKQLLFNILNFRMMLVKISCASPPRATSFH